MALKGSPEFAEYKTLVRELQAVDATSLGNEAERCVCTLAWSLLRTQHTSGC
jgi:hypothetical protein